MFIYNVLLIELGFIVVLSLVLSRDYIEVTIQLGYRQILLNISKSMG